MIVNIASEILWYFFSTFATVLTQILSSDTPSGQLQWVAASCGCQSIPLTSPRCSATSRAEPWVMPKCEHSCNYAPILHLHTLRSLLSSVRSLYLNMVGLWVTVSLAMFSGLTMFSIYKNCDPLGNGDINTSDQVRRTAAFQFVSW